MKTLETSKETKAKQSLGTSIRDLRKSHGWPLKLIAERTGLSSGMISLIERDLTSPSIRSLRLLATALEVPVERFFSDSGPEEATPDTLQHVIRPDDRKSLRLEHLGISIQTASPRNGGSVQMLIFEVEPGCGSGPEMDQHEGEESGLVMAGKLDFWIGEEHHVLTEGDTFQFIAATPHRYHNHSRSNTR